MLHIIIQLFRYIIGLVTAWVATDPFFSDHDYLRYNPHTAMTVIIVVVLTTLVDIRIELSQAREDTGWFK